jgi:glycosyltransferase involved in cell wall biosynthesis
MEFRNLSIIVISNEAWGDMWYSKHHYAMELRQHNEVFFVDPPPSWRPQNLFFNRASIKKVADNLYIVSYRNYLPFTVRSRILYRLNNIMVSALLKKFLKKQSNHPLFFFSFDPFRLHDPRALGAISSLYYSMDYYINRTEILLCRNVDMVIAVAETLLKKLKPYSRNVLLIPHGIPASLINTDNVHREREKLIVLTGTISGRTDFSLLLLLAERFPDYRLLLIGKLELASFSDKDHAEVKKLRECSNVTFTGAKPFDELKKDVAKARLALCCYKMIQEGNMLSSLRILQYLACGTEVLSTYMKEYDTPEAKEKIILVRTSEDFIKEAARILSQDDNHIKRKKRMEYASMRTYSILLRQIGESFEEIHAQ